MNGFHVDAIGWILICSARAFSTEEARTLTGLWEQAVSAHAEDLARVSTVARLLHRRSVRLSGKTTDALSALIRAMVSLHAERFDAQVLRARRNSWLILTGLGFVLSVVSGAWLRTWPIMDAVVPALFLLGCISMLSAVLLWRAATAVQRCETTASGRLPASAARYEPDRVPTGATRPVPAEAKESVRHAARSESETRTRI